MTSKLVRVLGMFAMLIALGACGDDEEAVTDAGPEPAKDAGLPNKAECLDMAEAMDSVVPEIDCLCEKCVREITDCNSDEGCREIQACAVKTGCRGTGCYFAEPECMGIIDEWGSTSLSTTLAQQLQDCTDLECGDGSKENCPPQAIEAQGMSVDLPGCCTATGRCGLMDAFITMSCIERSAFPFGTPLEPLNCDGTPVEVDADAGVADDGGTN